MICRLAIMSTKAALLNHIPTLLISWLVENILFRTASQKRKPTFNKALGLEILLAKKVEDSPKFKRSIVAPD